MVLLILSIVVIFLCTAVGGAYALYRRRQRRKADEEGVAEVRMDDNGKLWIVYI